MAITIPSDSEKFRAAVTPLFIFYVTLTMLGFVSILLIIKGPHLNSHSLAFASAFVLIMSLVWSWIQSVLYPVGFSTDGVYGYNWDGGKRRFIIWADIHIFKSNSAPSISTNQ
jgi:hypothetical protein